MPTIRDVSKRAGVSVATVSRLLNKSGYVSRAAESAVREAMRELNYSPNDVARSLAGKKSHTIALMVPDILNPYFPLIAKSVEREASVLGYNVLLCDSGNDPAKEARYFETLARKKMDGIVLASYSARPAGLAELMRREIPVVAIDNGFESDVPLLALVADNKRGAKTAVRHLAEQGCRKLAHLRGPLGVFSADERFEGFREACEELGMFAPERVVPGEFDFERAREATLALLRRCPDIDGIFAGNDLMAAGTLKALRESGIGVPEKVKVVGFDGLDMPFADAPLTSVRQPIGEMGAQAVRCLADLIDGVPIEKTVRRLNVNLIVRATSVADKEGEYHEQK